MKKLFSILILINVVIGALVLYFQWSGSGDSDNNYDYESDSSQEYALEKDYSWLYGTWQLTIDGETHTISFLSNGFCTSQFKSPYYGTSYDDGCYTIYSDEIKVDYGDGYPSYIEMDGERLTSNGRYYKKID